MIEIIKTVIYGLLSGLTEIIPVSSRGHQSVLMHLFGMQKRDPVLDLMVHFGILACVILCSREDLIQLRLSFNTSAKTRKAMNKQSFYQSRLLRSAFIPLLIGLFLYGTGSKFEGNPLLVALFFVINGVIIFIPEYVRQSNKNAGQMGSFDSILLGLSSAVCVFPGISRLGAGTSIAILRGADKQNAFHWLLLLTIPAMAYLIIFDIVSMFTVGLVSISIWLFIGYIFALAAAFAGSYIGISLMRFLCVNSGFSGFAFYSWGAAAFTFVLYLVAY